MSDSGKKSPSEDEMEQCKKSGGSRMNPHLRSMKQDVLYHLALSTHSSDLKEMFGDVKVGAVAAFCLKFLSVRVVMASFCAN